MILDMGLCIFQLCKLNYWGSLHLLCTQVCSLEGFLCNLLSRNMKGNRQCHDTVNLVRKVMVGMGLLLSAEPAQEAGLNKNILI